jgi:hypothetical protein
MAGRQGTPGRAGAGSLKPFGFATLAELRVLAAAADRPVSVVTPVNAGRYAGPAYYLEMLHRVGREYPDARFDGLLDCGDDAAIAVAALAMGWPGVILRGNAAARERVADIANRTKGRVLARRPVTTDLTGTTDPGAFCRACFVRP